MQICLCVSDTLIVSDDWHWKTQDFKCGNHHERKFVNKALELVSKYQCLPWRPTQNAYMILILVCEAKLDIASMFVEGSCEFDDSHLEPHAEARMRWRWMETCWLLGSKGVADHKNVGNLGRTSKDVEVKARTEMCKIILHRCAAEPIPTAHKNGNQ